MISQVSDFSNMKFKWKIKKERVQAFQLNHARTKDTGCVVAAKAGLSVKCSSYIALPLKQKQ